MHVFNYYVDLPSYSLYNTSKTFPEHFDFPLFHFFHKNIYCFTYLLGYFVTFLFIYLPFIGMFPKTWFDFFCLPEVLLRRPMLSSIIKI